MNDEFYIGYSQVAPAGLGRFIRRVIIAVACSAAAVCGIILFFQSRYPAKTFEFGVVKPWTGVIAAVPYPVLVAGDGSSYLLVAAGKHGFKSETLTGQAVRLNGTLIQFGPNRMLEVMLGPERANMTISVSAHASGDIGPVTLKGEIVDTKCHFGVMQPGNGKVHRGCAARCIAGGIPPGLMVHEADGSLRTILLAGADGGELHRELLPYVAERVRVRGTLVRSAGMLVLRADPAEISRE